jgi:hypothetical protein
MSFPKCHDTAPHVPLILPVMFHNTKPETMTAEQRMDEVAALLARAIKRQKLRRNEQSNGSELSGYTAQNERS